MVVDWLFIATPSVGVCKCSIFCCTLLFVHSSFAIILMRTREPVDLLSLTSWCFVIVVWPFLAVTWVCLQFVIVVFPDHTHLLLVAYQLDYFYAAWPVSWLNEIKLQPFIPSVGGSMCRLKQIATYKEYIALAQINIMLCCFFFFLFFLFFF